jgi:hypothetical protein
MLPSARAKKSRSEQNRRAYLRKLLNERFTKPLPVTVQDSAAEPIIEASNSYYPHLVCHFLEGEPECLRLGDCLELEARDFAVLMGLPPYSCTLLSLPTFFEEWPKLSAALLGVMLRAYLERCEGLVARIARLDAYELIHELNEEMSQLKRQYNALSKAQVRRRQATNVIVAGNKRWIARVMQYTWEDIVALKQGKEVLLATTLERKWILGNRMTC